MVNQENAANPADITPVSEPDDTVRQYEMQTSILKTRLILGTVLMTVVLGLLTADHFMGKSWFFAFLATLATVIGLLEFYKMARNVNAQPLWFVGTVFGSLMVLGQWCMIEFREHEMLRNLQHEGASLILFIYLITVIWFSVLRPEWKRAAQNISITTFGVLYIGYFMSYFIKIRALPHGEAMILLIFLGSKCTDIGAYLIGRRFGSTKLIPRVSPAKTVEGAAGGLLCGVVATVAVYFLTPLHGLQAFPLATALLLGCILAVCSMGGDLFESLIKRRYEVKDSATLFPAFGGMLDMIDSILLNGPLMYFIIIGSGILNQEF